MTSHFQDRLVGNIPRLGCDIYRCKSVLLCPRAIEGYADLAHFDLAANQTNKNSVKKHIPSRASKKFGEHSFFEIVIAFPNEPHPLTRHRVNQILRRCWWPSPLNSHIPLVSYPQRGGKLHLRYSVNYLTGKYIHTTSSYTECTTPPYACDYGDEVSPGVVDIGDFEDGAGAYVNNPIPPPAHTPWATLITPDKSLHEVIPTSNGWRTIDATGFLCLNNCATIIDRDGIRYTSPSQGVSKREDPNGNYIVTPSGGVTTDTLGRQIPDPSGTPTDTSGCTGTLPTSKASLWTLPGYQGGSMTYKICRAQVYFGAKQCSKDSQFGVPQCSIIDQNWPLIQSIVLPNNTAWTFQYDSDNPSNPKGATGNLLQITFPTGGYIKYGWSAHYYCQVNLSTNAVTYSYTVASRTVNANDGTGEHTTTYGFVNVNNGSPNVYTTTSTDALSNKTVYTLTAQGSSNCSFYETQRQSYDSAGTLLKTVSTDYYSTADPFYSLFANERSANTVPIRVTTTWPSGSVTKTETDYDSGSSGYLYGIPIAQRDYDYGPGSPGGLLKETFTSYQALANSNYLANNLLSLVSSQQTCSPVGQGGTLNCAGNTLVQRALTQNTYDQALPCGGIGGTSPCSSGISTQHEASPNGAYRGNLTTSGQWLNTSGSNLNTRRTFFDTGTPYQVTDPGGHTTTYAYSSTYAGAYPTTVTNALNQQTTNVYDFNAGVLISTTDPNQLITSYTYDSLWRLQQTTRPDSSVDTDTISRQESATPFTATLTSAINTSQNTAPLAVFDGLGRVSQTQHTTDPQGIVYIDTGYDALGRVASVSNPYRKGTDATTSTGTTTYTYDALNRKTLQTFPDGSAITTAYCGPWTLVTDPTGKWRRSRVDGLGRMVEVDEPNSPTASVNSNGCPGTGEPIWVTSHTVDALGNLTQVVQNGSHTRTFTYDSLSRLLTSANPEVGTITYTYNSDNLVLTKNDARNITATYSYEALHRATGVTYSNGDPSLTFTYDETNCLGLSTCQNIGHRTSMTDGAGSEKWAYQVDKANSRDVHQEQRTTNSSPNNITKTTTYYLDFQGNVTQIVYPTGRTINYTYDSANRPSNAADASNGITYVADMKTPPASTNCTSGAVCYTPQGSIYAMSLGQTTSFNGFNISETFNQRLQPSEIKASSSARTAIDITYNFVDPATSKNAGHVYGITNNLNSSRSQTFTYDQLNRITSAGTSATTGTYCWGYQYSYDAWGNLLSQAGWTPTYNGCTETIMGAVTADGNNHLSGLSYDASGNTLSDGNYSYTWDGESRMKIASGVTYTYDGDGRRIAKVAVNCIGTARGARFWPKPMLPGTCRMNMSSLAESG